MVVLRIENNPILRASRAFSLLLSSERGARGHAVQPAPHAPLALAHAARGEHAAARAAAGGARLRRHADAAGAAGAGAAAPAQHPHGLP